VSGKGLTCQASDVCGYSWRSGEGSARMVGQGEVCAAIATLLAACTVLLWRRRCRFAEKACSGIVNIESVNRPQEETTASPEATAVQDTFVEETCVAPEDQHLFQEIWTAVESWSPSCCASPLLACASPSPSSPSSECRLRQRRSRTESPEPRPVAAVAAASAAAAESSSDESDSFPDEPVLDLPPQELALVALINFATYDELTELKGVGPKSAKSILGYRATGAQFTCLDDLTKAGLAKTVKIRLLRDNV